MFLTAQFAGAQPYASNTYEPSARQRMRAESCMNDETAQGPLCVKRCDDDFKLETSGRKAICRATKAGAVRKPPKIEYQAPQRNPNAPPTVPGA
jgi:hypothetical protein